MQIINHILLFEFGRNAVRSSQNETKLLYHIPKKAISEKLLKKHYNVGNFVTQYTPRVKTACFHPKY